MIEIIQSDAVKWANEYEGKPFHALLCDPPYHLTSIVKRFGKDGSAPAKFGKDGAFARASKGFMGKTWDGGDIAFQPETWYAFMRILYPGAFGMAFASARGWHRLAVAIEDAGFIIHPTIFGWLYGSGFPKATRIDNQIDKREGKLEERIIGKKHGTGYTKSNAEQGAQQRLTTEFSEYSEPITDLAKAWAGHRYGLQVLKPALEPIIVFQKPYEGKPLENMIETGAGALNIEGGRISGESLGTRVRKAGSEFGQGSGWNGHNNVDTEFDGTKGRWPANFILEDEGAAKALDDQSGIQKGGFVRNRTLGARPFENNGKPTNYEMTDEIDEPDGGASRFFYRVQNQIDESDPVYYCSKVSNNERNSGLDVLESKRTSEDFRPNDDGSHGIQSRLHGATVKGRNPHPTLKPIDLARYLSTLLLPPTIYSPRRLFVPFAGAASECIGAFQALWEEIVGVEMEEQYCKIARLRVDHWTKKGIQPEMFK